MSNLLLPLPARFRCGRTAVYRTLPGHQSPQRAAFRHPCSALAIIALRAPPNSKTIGRRGVSADQPRADQPDDAAPADKEAKYVVSTFHRASRRRHFRLGRARANPEPKVYRVGLLSIIREGTCTLPGPCAGSRKARLYRRKTIEFERRPANGDSARLPGMAADFGARHVDLIIACSYPAAVAVLSEAPDVPIVAIHAGDPVETGMARSLSHPGGRITGVSEVSTVLSAKRLQLLKEAAPERAQDRGAVERRRSRHADALQCGPG